MKILIVDDSKAMRMILKRALRDAGIEAEIAEGADGSEGLAQAAAFNPDLVLSDWNMPVMTGIDFLRGLRQTGSEVMFGFVTTECTDDMKELASSEGSQFLLSKPFTSEQLREAIQPLLVG